MEIDWEAERSSPAIGEDELVDADSTLAETGPASAAVGAAATLMGSGGESVKLELPPGTQREWLGARDRVHRL